MITYFKRNIKKGFVRLHLTLSILLSLAIGIPLVPEFDIFYIWLAFILGLFLGYWILVRIVLWIKEGFKQSENF